MGKVGVFVFSPSSGEFSIHIFPILLLWTLVFECSLNYVLLIFVSFIALLLWNNFLSFLHPYRTVCSNFSFFTCSCTKINFSVSIFVPVKNFPFSENKGTFWSVRKEYWLKDLNEKFWCQGLIDWFYSKIPDWRIFSF